MRGADNTSTLRNIILMILVAVIAIVLTQPYFSTFGYEKYAGAEKKIGSMSLMDFDVDTITPTRPPTDDLRKINELGTHYISEIACIIAEDIYNDFTKYGERGRDYRLIYREDSPINREFNCEWIWDKDCCPAYNNLPKDDEGKFVCLINAGIFTVGQNEALSDEVKSELTDLGCSLDCTSDGTTEYELDEVCVNHNLALKEFPKGSGISFCTDGYNEEIRISYDSQQERQKFGNEDCYANNNNDGDAWRDLCDRDPPGPLCIANGFREDGTELTYRELDRIYSWKADWIPLTRRSSDRYLVENRGIVSNIKYFYTLYWNNKDERGEAESKSYKVELPSIITYDYKDRTNNINWDDFLDFIEEFYDEEEDIRHTTAGIWFRELRTSYDMTVILSSSLTLNLLQQTLEGISDDFDVSREPCTVGVNCVNYGIDAVIYEENLGSDSTSKIRDTVFEKEAPITIKYNDNVEKDGHMLMGGERYRIIVRNWMSNWYGATRDSCGRDERWCIDEDRIPGQKIFCSEEDIDDLHCIGTITYSRTPIYKITYPRYSDRNLIIIKLPSCTETDGGQDYFNAGSITVDDGITEPQTYDDACIGSMVLDEKYCTSSGEPESEAFICDNGCDNDACNP